MWYRLTFSAVLLIVLSLSSAQVWAAHSSQYSISLAANPLTASITLAIAQNLTAYQASFSLPQIHSIVEGPNATSAAQAVQAALQTKSPGTQVKNLQLEVNSSAWSSQADIQWFNVSLSMEV